MSLFGKKRVREVEAANQFLQQIRSEIFSNWPSICQRFSELAALEPGKPAFSACADNAAAAFEFYLAVVAMQIRATSNLLPNAQASRIQQYVDGYLKAIPADTLKSLLLPSELFKDQNGFEVEGDDDWDEDEDGEANITDSTILKVFYSYLHAFDELVEEGDPVISGPAYFLCRRLNLLFPPSIKQPGGGLVRPMLTATVFQMMTDIGGSWWKDYLQRHSVVS